MKALQIIVLTALLAAAHPAKSHGNDEDEKVARQKEISLTVRGLLHEFQAGWALPQSHLVFIQIVPNPNGGMVVKRVVTGHRGMEKSLSAYLVGQQISVNCTVDIVMRVWLKP